MIPRKVACESYGQGSVEPFHVGEPPSRAYIRRLKQIFGLTALKAIFVPKGYPTSVSSDYLEYQVWDTIQALASSITGTLSAQAVLLGVGVGDAQATILGASLSWMLKDGAGMLGKILFVGWQGSNLDCDCKRWRLLADILNDGSLFLELSSPFIPQLFTPILCTANVLRAIVGVAGGATRVAVTQHQALDNNTADVAAKDASQETLSNLLALFLNMSLIYFVTGNWGVIWVLFVLLTIVHLYANYRAVKCLKFTTFNRNRFAIAVRPWLQQQLQDHEMSDMGSSRSTSFPTIDWVNDHEPILGSVVGTRIHLGCSLHDLPTSGVSSLPDLIKIFSSERYLLYCPDWRLVLDGGASARFSIYIILVNGCHSRDQLQAMLHAELLLFISKLDGRTTVHSWLSQIRSSKTVSDFSHTTLVLARHLFDQFEADVTNSPEPCWNLNALHFSAGQWRSTWIN
ncbi:unnamed protein product [Calicophoron daubneyi]|uniref:Uncharacterized protein n=1 Tax=Calicophoron daubneyi TaxID=300641 RepID=A0AAV2T1Z3_CALDB